MLTIFTPTYNRAYSLPRLYESLCAQTCRDFEWLIVDDGSTDNTEELVKSWVNDSNIIIRYIKQPNGGKHRAINRGVDIAQGDWFVIVDSDDYLTADAVEWITEQTSKLVMNHEFGGVSGICINAEGEKIGGGKDFGLIDSNPIDIRLKYHIVGDMAEVFRTDVLKEFPFPEIEGEKFCPEALVWFRIARKYKVRFVHKGIYVCEYLPDGLTAKITRIRRESPVASMIYYSEHSRDKIAMKYKFKAAINFWRFATKPYNLKRYEMNNILSYFAYPIGKIMRRRDDARIY